MDVRFILIRHSVHYSRSAEQWLIPSSITQTEKKRKKHASGQKHVDWVHREKPGKEESSQGKGDFPTNGCWFPGSLAKKFRVQLPKFRAAAIRSRVRRVRRSRQGDGARETREETRVVSSMNAPSVFAYPLLTLVCIPDIFSFIFLYFLFFFFFFFFIFSIWAITTPTNRVSNKVRRRKNDARDQRIGGIGGSCSGCVDNCVATNKVRSSTRNTSEIRRRFDLSCVVYRWVTFSDGNIQTLSVQMIPRYLLYLWYYKNLNVWIRSIVE